MTADEKLEFAKTIRDELKSIRNSFEGIGDEDDIIATFGSAFNETLNNLCGDVDTQYVFVTNKIMAEDFEDDEEETEEPAT